MINLRQLTEYTNKTDIVAFDHLNKIVEILEPYNDCNTNEIWHEISFSNPLKTDFIFRLTDKCKLVDISEKQIKKTDGISQQAWFNIHRFAVLWCDESLYANNFIKSVSFEYDYEQITSVNPIPCMFFEIDGDLFNEKFPDKNLSQLYKDISNSSLKQLYEPNDYDKFTKNFENILKNMGDKAYLWQLGLMYSRMENEVRIFTSPMAMEECIEFLKLSKWNGSFEKLILNLEKFKPYIDNHVIMDFDLSDIYDGVSEKVGFSLHCSSFNSLKELLNILCKNNICEINVANSLLSWCGRTIFKDTNNSFSKLILKSIAHFKLRIINNKLLGLKAYLRAEC